MENGKNNSVTIKDVMDYINTNDSFCKNNDIQLVEVTEEYSKAVLNVQPYHMNSKGVVQGGAIFTLCDIAFAGLANSSNNAMLAMNASISYLRPGLGKQLVAVATKINRGKRTGVYSADVTDENGKLVAHAVITGFDTGSALIKEEK